MKKSSVGRKSGAGSKFNFQRLSRPIRRYMRSRFDRHRLRTFMEHLWEHFRADRSFEAAAALSYTTLLALVPLMAVMFGVVSAFPVFDRWAIDVEAYIFANFVPAAGDQIREYLQEFVGRTTGLTGAGTIFLIVTAILLMATIEKSLNRIWRVSAERGPINRLLIYWAALTLGPMLMGASLALTSYLTAIPIFTSGVVESAMLMSVLNLMPFIVALAGFALLFLIVPNRRVRWHHALLGAFVSALLFELASRGFVFYVSNFPTYERLYGALATVPLFLVWIYISWVVVLLGASLAASLTTFNYERAGWRWPRRHELFLALRLLGHFWHMQRRGQSLSTAELQRRESAATDQQLRQILGYFSNAGFIHCDDEGDWLLSADLDEVTLMELYRAGPFIMPFGELENLPIESHWDRALVSGLAPVDQKAGNFMHCSIKSLLQYDRVLEDHTCSE